MPSRLAKLFYKGNKLSTLHTNSTCLTVVSANKLNLCETSSQAAQARLLGTDQQASTIITKSESHSIIAYSPYGNDNLSAGNLLLARFTGQYLLPLATGYLLGNGHRQFYTTLMRFISADSFSPFGKGGLNTYAYCGNDPINRTDPTGQSFTFNFKKLKGGYSYKTLSKRLKLIEPNFSTREYKSLSKSLEKRLKREPGHHVFIEQQKTLNSLKLLQIDGKKDRYFNPAAFTSFLETPTTPGTQARKSLHRDSTTSETFSELNLRFEALIISPEPSTAAARIPGNPGTWPRPRPASDNMLAFTGNYIDKTVFNLRRNIG